MPKSARSSLYLEHHILSDLFQVTYELLLPSRACVFQDFHQPRQRCLLGFRSRLQVLHLHGLSLVMAVHPVYCRTSVCMCVWATYFGPISSDTSPRAFTAAPISGMTSVVTGAHILLSLFLYPGTGTGSGYLDRTFVEPLKQHLFKQALRRLTPLHTCDLAYMGVFPYTLDEDDLGRRNSWVDRGPRRIKLLGSSLGRSK
jgi:hypothetical protein